MNSNDHPLKTVATKILEDWAFMMVDPEESGEELLDLSSPLYLSCINIGGAFNGTILIMARESFISQLAINLLGENDTTTIHEIDSHDAFREMANVLAGNFITTAYGADVSFDMLNPSVALATEDDLNKFKNSAHQFFFIADDNLVGITFAIKN